MKWGINVDKITSYLKISSTDMKFSYWTLFDQKGFYEIVFRGRTCWSLSVFQNQSGADALELQRYAVKKIVNGMKKKTFKLISLFISKESTSQYGRVLFLLKALLWYDVLIHAKRIMNELVFRQRTSMNDCTRGYSTRWALY